MSSDTLTRAHTMGFLRRFLGRFVHFHDWEVHTRNARGWPVGRRCRTCGVRETFVIDDSGWQLWHWYRD